MVVFLQPPLCTSDGRNLRRIRRQVQETEISKEANKTADGQVNIRDLSVSVHSGLHVEDSYDLKSSQGRSDWNDQTLHIMLDNRIGILLTVNIEFGASLLKFYVHE